MMQPIEITDKAAMAIQESVQGGPEGAVALRLNIKPTGCWGNSYAMEFVKAADDVSGDDRLERNGAVLYVPKTFSWMLFGMRIDYGSDDLGNEKFEFSNPNETGRCGCGESFQVSREELR
mgnify:CR=1 FL=1